MKRRNALYTLIACILVAVIAVGCTFTGAQNDPVVTPIDWQLHGAWISPAGEVGEAVEFSIKGTITDYADKDDILDLEFTFPEGFRYDMGTLINPDLSIVGQVYGAEYFVCPAYCHDKETGEGPFRIYALSVDAGHFIFHVDNCDNYLVGSIHSDIDPQDILAYFQEFREIHHTDD